MTNEQTLEKENSTTNNRDSKAGKSNDTSSINEESSFAFSSHQCHTTITENGSDINPEVSSNVPVNKAVVVIEEDFGIIQNSNIFAVITPSALAAPHSIHQTEDVKIIPSKKHATYVEIFNSKNTVS